MNGLDMLLVSLAVLAAGAYLARIFWRALQRRGKAEGDIGCGCHTCHFPDPSLENNRDRNAE